MFIIENQSETKKEGRSNSRYIYMDQMDLAGPHKRFQGNS